MTSVDAVQASADNIQTSVDIVHSSVDNVRTEEVLGRLKSVPARYNGENTPNRCMDGTRVEIINDIVHALTAAPNPSQRLVILSGSAGSGKSTIAKTIAYILAEQKALAGSFFFSRDYADRNTLRGLPSTLARQLADYDPIYRNLLVKLLEEDRIDIPHLQFQKLVVELLQRRSATTTPWVICLDALDECGKDHGQVLLRWLSDSIAQVPTYIHFFLTGRPEVPSYLKFDVLQSLKRSIVLDDLDSTITEHDIQLYIRQSLDGEKWTTRSPWKAQQHDVDEITKRAAGLFVFAATCVRYILAGLPHVDPQDSVRYLLNGAPLMDLNDLYLRIVDEAISVPQPGDLRAQDSHNHAMQVLGTILHLYEPLDTASLAQLLQMDVKAVIRVLAPLSAVINVPEAAAGTIKVIHLSFREFMTSVIVHKRPDLLCGGDSQQWLVSLNILRVMQAELKFNICDLPTSYLANMDMPDIQLRLATHISDHLRYSCQYWADHLTNTALNSDRAKEAEKFLTTKFLFWIEVLSLLGMVRNSLTALSKCIAWTKGSVNKQHDTHGEHDQFLSDFCSDAKQFIAFFLPPIVQCAPQIYISALALAPTESLISTIFRPAFPRLVSVSRGQMKQWPVTIAVLEGHTQGIESVAFSPDGKLIISGSWDRTIRIWDAESGEQLGDPLEGHAHRVSSVAFSPDGKWIVSGSHDETIRIWDAES
ncbi:hypothetical protein DFH06DRAFT_1015013, partial [Mycena polygramma]